MARLAALGVDAVALTRPDVDILVPASLPPALRGFDIVANLATRVPRAGMPPDFTLNNRIRTEGMTNLLAALPPGARLIQQSIAFVCGDGANWVDEDAPPRPGPFAATAIAMEAMIRDAGIKATILRGGAFYGHGTGTPEWQIELARAGKLMLQGDGGDYLSPIHVEDMADAVVAAIRAPAAPPLLNIVDDEPLTWRDYYHRLGFEPPPGGPMRLLSHRVSNARAKADLDWRPRHATFGGVM
jgi:nucleoside-diphosphate-sugar epimerase